MLSQHLNTLFGTFWYVLSFAPIISPEKCRTLTSRPITFSMNSEEEIDENCFMKVFWELDNVLGTRINKKSRQKQKQLQLLLHTC
jgi:hypothetical protein